MKLRERQELVKIIADRREMDRLARRIELVNGNPKMAIVDAFLRGRESALSEIEDWIKEARG